METDSSPLIQPDLDPEFVKQQVVHSEGGEQIRPEQIPQEYSSTETAEKPAKVQKTSGLFGVISNLASGLTTASQTVLEQAKEATKIVQKSVEDHTIIGKFNKMQSDFIQEKQSREKAAGAAPWIGDKNEEELKRLILGLSADKRNFMRDPPAGANFDFDMESVMPVAKVLLQEDPELEKRRFELVPKALNETTFWRNYFYRISLIKQSSMLTSSSPDDQIDSLKPRADIDRDDISVASNLDLMDGSVVGDSDTHAEEHQVILPCNPPLLIPNPKASASSTGVTRASDEGWEKELQQTLDSYEVVGGDVADSELDQALTMTVDDRQSV